MGYGLLWVEALAAGLLFVAMVLAVTARRGRWVAAILVWGAVMLALVPGLIAVTGSLVLRFKWNLEHDWLIYSAGWLTALIVGLVWIFRRAGRTADGVRASTAWPGGRLALLAGAALALAITTFWNLDAAVRAHLAFTRNEANMMFMSVAQTSIPDQSNAALVYEKAFLEERRLRLEHHGAIKQKELDAWIPLLGKAEYPTADPAVVDYFKKRQGEVALLRRAAAMPGCYFDRDSRDATMASMLLPELSRLSHSGRVLAGDARVKAANGKLREAFENIVAIDHMAAHTGAQPILISGLVALALERIAAEALEGILTTTTPSTADLEPLMAENPFLVERVMYRSLKGEEASGLMNLADLADGAFEAGFDIVGGNSGSFWEGNFLRGSLAISLWRVFLVTDDLAAFREYRTAIHQYIGQTTEGRLYGKSSFKEGLAKAKEFDDARKVSKKGVLTKLITPALTRCIELMVNDEALLRMRKLGVAYAAYRAKNGQWPEKVEALVPEYIAEIPLDPFDDKPLRVKKDGKRIVFYSVGLNGVDDGGVEPVQKRTTILFHVGTRE